MITFKLKVLKMVIGLTILSSLLTACGFDEHGRLSIPIKELKKEEKPVSEAPPSNPAYMVSDSSPEELDKTVEYSWFVGNENPIDRNSNVMLAGVEEGQIMLKITHLQGEADYFLLNIKEGKKLQLYAAAIVVTGMYPEDNKITFTVVKGGK